MSGRGKCPDHDSAAANINGVLRLLNHTIGNVWVVAVT